ARNLDGPISAAEKGTDLNAGWMGAIFNSTFDREINLCPFPRCYFRLPAKQFKPWSVPYYFSIGASFPDSPTHDLRYLLLEVLEPGGLAPLRGVTD
ncbi:MAG: hypothetical protein P8180_17905, partial [Gammaproteobacteria bacterium]